MFAATRWAGASTCHHADALPHAAYVHLLTRGNPQRPPVSEIVIVDVQMLAANKVALLEWLYAFRHDVVDVAVWDKGRAQPVMARNVLNNRFEFLWFLTRRRSKGKTPRTLFTADFRGTVSNVYAAPPRQNNPYHALHAATFPLHLPPWLMPTFDSQAGPVYDPFLGTGTTLIAAERLGRTLLRHGDRASLLRPRVQALAAGERRAGDAAAFPAWHSRVGTVPNYLYA